MVSQHHTSTNDTQSHTPTTIVSHHHKPTIYHTPTISQIQAHRHVFRRVCGEETSAGKTGGPSAYSVGVEEVRRLQEW